MPYDKKHRGRIQAQGGGVEESGNWTSDIPPTVEDGLEMLQNLQDSLSPKERQNRQELFEKAERFIRAAGAKNGLTAQVSKSFLKKDSKDIRIDIEVIAGVAFVSVALVLFLIYL